MTGDRVHIDSMQLNIPGLTMAEGAHLKRDVAHWMERLVPVSMPKRNLETLNLQVPVSDTTPRSLLAEMIAKQICKSLS